MLKQFLRQWFRYWLPPLAWMGLIFILSAQPDLPHAPGPWLDLVLKKIGHAAAYGVLAWLYLRAMRRHSAPNRPGAVLRAASVCLAVVYALSDEYHQTFVAGRNGNLLDVGVDGVGAFTAVLLDWRLAHQRTLSRRAPDVR